MYDVVIVDDNQEAIEKLRLQLKEYTNFTVTATAFDGNSARSLILKQKPHLLFLDIELPDMDAFELICGISPEVDWDMEIVFYTAYNKYVIKAIRNSVFDYLVKPVNKGELDETLDRFCKKVRMSTGREFVEKINAFPRENILLISTVHGKRLLQLNDIGLIRYDSHSSQWEVSLTDQTVLKIKHKTSARNILAFSEYLVRVNQAAIVNINYLKGVEQNKCVFHPPFTEQSDVTVSREGRKELEERLFSL